MKKTLILALASMIALMFVLSSGCQKKNPAEAMMNHNVAIAKILKDNISDCDKAVAGLTVYTEKNKSSIDEARKAIAEAASKPMSEEDTKANAAKAREISDAMNDFSQNCPDHMQKVSDIYAALFEPKQ